MTVNTVARGAAEACLSWQGNLRSMVITACHVGAADTELRHGLLPRRQWQDAGPLADSVPRAGESPFLQHLTQLERHLGQLAEHHDCPVLGATPSLWPAQVQSWSFAN